MKELIVGDISIYSEDDDSWDDLVKVVKKLNRAYLDSMKDPESVKKESWLERMKKRIGDKSILPFLII